MDSGPETFSNESEMGVKPYVRLWPGLFSCYMSFYSFETRSTRFFDVRATVSDGDETSVKISIILIRIQRFENRVVGTSYAKVTAVYVNYFYYI